MRAATPRLLGAAVVAGALAVCLVACSDDSAQSDGTTSASPGQSVATDTSAAPPSKTDSPVSQNSNAPAVPGPSLPPATSIPESKLLPALGGTRCDTVNGPDGTLHVVILGDGSIDCAVAMPIAKAYSPMIATGKTQQVQGWDCGPSQTRGVLSRCTMGADTIAFSIE
ncbi:hypothetical protein [Williamsia sp.]|uniref:hypothetical protein n=1 Tax=Williamsia sp. TaxID=1872085 RepID=UPI002F95C8A4